MVMKYLDIPILQCEIQRLPTPDTATVFRKSPTCCFARVVLSSLRQMVIAPGKDQMLGWMQL